MVYGGGTSTATTKRHNQTEGIMKLFMLTILASSVVLLAGGGQAQEKTVQLPEKLCGYWTGGVNAQNRSTWCVEKIAMSGTTGTAIMTWYPSNPRAGGCGFTAATSVSFVEGQLELQVSDTKALTCFRKSFSAKLTKTGDGFEGTVGDGSTINSATLK